MVLFVPPFICVFFFNDTATTEIYTLSLHDALPISNRDPHRVHHPDRDDDQQHEGQHSGEHVESGHRVSHEGRSEEHTSELQSPDHLVCRLLLEKKKKEQVVSIEFSSVSENAILSSV